MSPEEPSKRERIATHPFHCRLGNRGLFRASESGCLCGVYASGDHKLPVLSLLICWMVLMVAPLARYLSSFDRVIKFVKQLSNSDTESLLTLVLRSYFECLCRKATSAGNLKLAQNILLFGATSLTS